MTNQNRPFTDPDERVPERLQRDLRGLFAPPGAVPPQIDRAIMGQARRRLARPRRMILRLRWAGGIAAAAAAIVIGVALLNPQSEIMSPPALTGGRDPQSIRPGLAEGRADIDNNGRVDILDAFRLARQLASGDPMDTRWDLNGDGRVDQGDVDQVAAAAVRLEPAAQAHSGASVPPVSVRVAASRPVRSYAVRRDLMLLRAHYKRAYPDNALRRNDEQAALEAATRLDTLGSGVGTGWGVAALWRSPLEKGV